MLLKYAKLLAEKLADEPLSDAVIAVPPFYTQAERIAVIYAAKLADLNVLQLINDNTAGAFEPTFVLLLYSIKSEMSLLQLRFITPFPER